MRQAEPAPEEPRDPGTMEVQVEKVENIQQAEAIDAAFAARWTEHLQAACHKAVADEPGDAGLFEACRRAFREGFHTGARGLVPE